MMTLSEMKIRKGELGYSYQMLSDMSGLPLSTVQKLLGGVTRHPRRKTLEALERVFTENPEDSIKRVKFQFPYAYDERPVPAGHYPDMEEGITDSQSGNFILRENSAAYAAKDSYDNKIMAAGKKFGNHIEDYYALPDDARMELIDGCFYDMSGSPNTRHQMIAAELFSVLHGHIRAHGGTCVPFMAPLDVLLDEMTIVQPDVFVVCDRSRIQDRIHGAPDLIIEILSPSTAQKDRFIKIPKYKSAGVRECWLIDPDRQKIVVIDFDHEDDICIYGFLDSIPIGIWGGDCSVDFAEIYRRIAFLYQTEK